jgi:tellurite resistance protein
MRIETPAEACAALAVLIVGADEVGTSEEGQFLFETVASLPIFEGLNRAQFTRLMADATEGVWSSVPIEGSRLSEDGVSEVLGRICEALPAELRTEAFEGAVGLARADGISDEEALLLERLCEGLEIDPDLARELLNPQA